MLRNEIDIGVDPGANFTGTAVMLDGEFVFWCESEDPLVSWEVIFCNAVTSHTRVIVEDFLGGGHRDKFIQRTIEILGFIYYSCLAHRISVVRVPPQQRKSCVNRVPGYISGKDERSAAAHVLAYREKNGITSEV